jgi:hypothetical protein
MASRRWGDGLEIQLHESLLDARTHDLAHDAPAMTAA